MQVYYFIIFFLVVAGVNKWSTGSSQVDGVLKQLQPQVIDDDDELNKDEDEEDEFSVMVKEATFRSQDEERLSVMPDDDSHRLSIPHSDSMDCIEESEDVIFYADEDNVTDNAPSTFKVFEGHRISATENGNYSQALFVH